MAMCRLRVAKGGCFLDFHRVVVCKEIDFEQGLDIERSDKSNTNLEEIELGLGSTLGSGPTLVRHSGPDPLVDQYPTSFSPLGWYRPSLCPTSTVL